MNIDFDNKEDNTENMNNQPNTIEKQLDDLKNDIKFLSEKVNILEQKLNIDTPIEEIPDKENKNSKKRKKKFLWVGEGIFYLVLILIVLGALLIRGSGDGKPTSFAGFSMFTVLTSSMESEIPKGSLVITKQVPVEDLKIGDDITYMASETTTITHRIIGITEKYKDTGKRAFETKGVDNAKPDKNLVPAVNVVGKVVFHSETLGTIAKFIRENWPFVIFVLVILIVFISVMKMILKKDRKVIKRKIKTKKEKHQPEIDLDMYDIHMELEERK